LRLIVIFLSKKGGRGRDGGREGGDRGEREKERERERERDAVNDEDPAHHLPCISFCIKAHLCT
jgi:hypothetical protein